MKKFKILLTVLFLTISLALVMCFCGGCDFVQYVETSDNNQISDEIKQLQEDYVDKLYSVTSEIKYRENEQKIFEYAVQDAVNELYECRSEEDLKQVYDKHLVIIGKIKTDKEYSDEEEANAISAYRVAVLGQAEKSYDKQKYTETQVTYFDTVFATFSGELFETNVKEEMDELLQKFYFDVHKEDEILSLVNYVDISIYEDSQKEILTDTLDKCIEDIRACDDKDEIGAIKSVYEFEVYKRDTVKKLNGYVDLQLYRDEQVTEIKQILAKHLKLAEEAENNVEEDNIFREYQIAVYGIPTDETLYNEELESIKKELSGSLVDSYKLSFYRESEALAVQKLLKSFQDLLESIKKKEDVLSQYILIKGKLDFVKTAAEMDADDRVNLIEELYAQLQDEINTDIDEKDKETYLAKADLVYASMKDRVSLESIKQEYRIFAQEIAFAHGAALDVLKEELSVYNNAIYYRETEQNEVNALKEEYLVKFTDDLGMESAKALLQEAKDAIDEIKTNDDLWNDSVTKFRNDLKALYGDAILEEPRSLTEANDYYELANIIDYYAFYQLSGTEFVCDTFRVKLNFDHGNAEDEINNVFWNCELIRSGAGIYGELEQNHYIVLTLIPYNLASISNSETQGKAERHFSLVEYKNETETIPRDENFDDFPYKKYNKTIKGIWNTQQLWYALEHEYLPVCADNSPAEQTLIKAKEILREIIKEGMSDEAKIFNIYTWFGKNVHYDYSYTKDFYQSVLEKYPEAATSKGFHAEGAIFDGLAVCEGYAKAYVLLLRLEGIESYRIVKSPAVKGRIIRNYDGEKYYSGGYGSHAFVGIRMSDGYLYYSDTEQSFVSGKSDLLMYQQFMVSPSLFVGYSGKNFLLPNIELGSSYWQGYKNFEVDETSLFISNPEQLKIVTSYITNLFTNNVQISLFCDLNVYPNIKDDLISLINFDIYEKVSSNGDNTFVEFIIFN